MFNISNNGFITLVRGDSLCVPLFIDQGVYCQPVRYSLKDHEKAAVYFGLMEPNQPFEKAILKKKYTVDSNINENGDIMITLEPKDTLNLLPGKYYYQIKVKGCNGIVDTVVPKTEFWIYD